MHEGSLAEQYFAQQFLSATGDAPLHCYTNGISTSEIDFVIQCSDAYPVGVKAETNLRGKNISAMLKSSPNLKGSGFSMAGCKEQANLTNVPLYLAEGFIKTMFSDQCRS